MLLFSLAALASEPDVRELVWARSFELAEPHQPNTPGSAAVTQGWLVELRVDPAKAAASQVAPALYAGSVPVYRTNWDEVGGCAVVIVPAPLELAKTPFYFGSTALPESADIDAERTAAEARGVQPLGVAAALAAGGERLYASDLRDVYAVAADRIEACAPHEKRRAESLRSR